MARLTSAPPLLLLLLHLICVISSVVFTPSVAVDTLTPKHALTGDGTLVSAGEIFVLGFFTPQGSKYRYLGIWYHFSKVSIQTVVWVANREQPIRDNTGSLWIAGNGTFYVTSGNNNVSIWSSPFLSLRNPVAQLLDNGNFVVREAGSNASDSKSYAWQSFYHPTDTILPGMEFGWDVDTGLNNTLVAWTSSSDPSPSEFSLILEHHGVPQHEVWKGSTLFWRSGPWNGLRFSGIPVMKSYNMFTFKFEMRPGVVIYTFDELNASFISRLTLNQSGSMQRLLWIQEKQYWNTIWSAPTDQCDTPSLCGTYGVCSTDGDFVCSCIQGFNPRVPATWALRDGSGGCVRNNSLNCKTDGFLLLTGAKLPDTWNSSLDMSLTLEQCRQKCVGNCSCTAYASADISTGLGCLIWVDDLTDIRTFGNGGQDLYVRLAEVDLPKSMRMNNVGKTRVAIVAASLATGIGALALLVCFICWKMKRRDAVLPGTLRNKSNVSPSVSHANRSGVIKDEDGEVELPIYDFETIRAATTDFSPSNMLGEGGFGLVYKGKFAEGQEIAVKRLSKSSVQGTIEFKNEVMLIAKLQHRNLVRLLGCSIAGEERILVYEYMPNKSLDAFLFEKDKGVHLSWQVRFNIIVGIARGLLYLHQDSRLRIIHRDLKAANILLDNDLNPKISDFGLARIFSDDDSMSMTLKVVGTYGYMSPEYAMNGLFSVKSDVFSFGVLVLEIISGVRNKGVFHSKPNDYLLGKAWSLWHDGRSLELIDPLISEECTMAEVMKCIKVGLLCVQEDPEDRPTMSSVVIMLVSDNMTLPEPKQPGFVARKDDMDLQSSGSVSYVTLTNVAGR